MSIFNFLTMLGGLALFLFGMNVMGTGLEKQAGSKLKTILERLTSNPIKGFFLGLVVTAVIQSSSATTVMVVGFVNSGIMQLRQAIGIIMGANVGTTVTSWIVSLTGLQGDSFFIQLLKPSSFSPVLAVIGIILYMFVKSDKKKNIGTILLGFAVLMFGMETMSGAVQPLADIPEFTNILLLFSNPLLGVLAGAILTGIIQSSSASVAILQALSFTGSVTYGSAIPIIMGQNIGTCVTALLSSVGTSKNAKRAAMVHLYFNIIGTVIFLTLFYSLNAVFHFSFIDDSINTVGIAVVHTCFNLLTTAVMLPFNRLLEKLACLTIRDSKNTKATDEISVLDPRLLATPSVAINLCEQLTSGMAEVAKSTVGHAIEMLTQYDDNVSEMILLNENKLDEYEDKIGNYLVQISSQNPSTNDSKEISKLLHAIGEFERIGDHAVNILEVAQEIKNKNITFSEEANKELEIITEAVQEVLNMAIEAFVNNNVVLAKKVEPLEEVVDYLRNALKNHHIIRLKEGNCTIETGFVFSDLLTNYERIADHCSNLAICVIEIENGEFESHEYLNTLKESENPTFIAEYKEYMEKYALPEKKSV